MATTRGHFLVVRSRLENNHPLDTYEGGGEYSVGRDRDYLFRP